MAAQVANTAQFVDIPIFSALIPGEGPKALQVSMDFSLNNAYEVDLLLNLQRHQISMVQTLFIDNSLSATATTVQIRGSSQQVVCPPKAQGFFPVLVPQPPHFTFVNASPVIVTVIFVNVPVPASVWSILQGGLPIGGTGAILVSDPIIEAAISGNAMSVLNITIGNNDIAMRHRIGNVGFSSVINAVGPTNFGPAGVAGAFITDLQCYVTANATFAAAALLTVTLADNTVPGTPIATGTCWIPAAAPTTLFTPPALIIQWEGDVGVNLKSNGAHFTATLSAALVTGSVVINCCGGITGNIS